MAGSEGWRYRAAALVAADVLVINLAFASAYYLRYELGLGPEIQSYVSYAEYLPWGLALSGILVALMALEGQYGRRRRTTWFESMYSVVTSTIVGVAVLAVLLFGVRPEAQSRLMLPYAALTTVVGLALVRAADAGLRRRRRRKGIGVSRTLIVGAGESGRAVMRNIMARPDLGLSVVGFLDDDEDKASKAIGRFDPLGGTGCLERVLDEQGADLVIITLPWTVRERIMELVDCCESRGVRVRIVPDLLQLSLNRVETDSLNGIPVIAVRAPAIQGWRYREKRAMDLALAGLTAALLSPIMLAIAAAIRLESSGPVLYRQQRVGRGGRPFTLYKFRSMVVDADAHRAALADRNEATGPIFKMRDDPRITRVGRFIRRTSLDELPQLWNVLRGDMSLVGPRPPMPSEVIEYQEWHRRRLEVAPGLTGLWQVSGRSKLTFDEMVMLDLFYAENWSLGMDLKILLRTVPTVLMGTGAY